MTVLIIAEAGVNHNGDLDVARRLIDSAAVAGADVVKFQTFNADRLVTRKARKAEYQIRTTSEGESQHDMIRRLELQPEMHHVLMEHCRARGIAFLSTPFDNESVDFLAALGIDRFKVPSGEVTNLPYLRRIGRHGKSVMLSTGMCTLGEIEAALDVLERAGTPRSRITILHCNTEYPTPMCDVNLRAMQSVRYAFDVAVGYSDHTVGIEVPVAAVALGATIIEKHFTLDRTMPGPDHKASLEPDEFKAMVAAIRNIELALGTGRKLPSPSEIKNKEIARKSIVAARPIRAGEHFTEENLAVKRPGTGVSPMRWDEVIGRRAGRAYATDELIEI